MHKHSNLYSNTMALMQSEAPVHWGWGVGTSVLSTFRAWGYLTFSSDMPRYAAQLGQQGRQFFNPEHTGNRGGWGIR